jgi:hypothetical protein
VTALDPRGAADSTGIARWQMPAFVVGILGVIATLIGLVLAPQEAYRGYLTSYLFWFSISAGCLAVLMLQYVTGGEWGVMIRRPLGAAARALWVMLLLLVPMFFGLVHIYPWNDRADAHFHEIAEAKGWYLNPTFFAIRAAVYFAFLLIWAWRIRVLSLEFYKTRSPFTELSRRKWASSGIVLIVLVLTFFSVDWMMSTEPGWYSHMYGITFVVGCGLSAFAFVTFFLSRMAHKPAMAEVLKPMHLRDLGNLLLAFVMFYAYVSFSEFLLIWYGNIHEEIPHYLWREHGVWGWLAAAIVLFHFFLPFFMLLMRSIKDRPETIGIVTVIVLVMRYVAIYWTVAPGWYRWNFHYAWPAIASLVGIGGLWLAEFIRQLKGQTIIPIHETWVEEAIREGALKLNA